MEAKEVFGYTRKVEVPMLRKGLILLFLIAVLLGEAKPPQLTPRDVKIKVDEILKAHVCYKSLTPELVHRIFANFLEELDPLKVYFLQTDIQPWLEPSEAMVQRGVKSFESRDFSLFQEIHALLVGAIERRNALEADLASVELPQDVRSEEFKDISWAATQDELKERLLRMKALQIHAASQLGNDHLDLFVQRSLKRRLNREAELCGSSVEERFKVTLSYVLKAFSESLDPHTHYFTPTEANQFMILVQQRLFGIGAQLRDELDGLLVVRIIENSPASQNNKLKINDKIIAVNHESIIGMDIAEAVELVRGEKGTLVHLTVLREGDKVDVEIVRGEVVFEEGRLETSVEPFGDGVIATLKLYTFYQDAKSSSSADIRKALEQIKKEENLKAVILDLRSNAGGLMGQAVSVSGLFMNKGIVVSVKDASGKLQHLREIEGKPAWEGPLLVLVNRGSASAAEIVAQGLQDYGRALVVGDPNTFGKGSYQTLTLDAVNNPKVSPQGEYKVTRNLYYTVSGKSPQLSGVQSDIAIPGVLTGLEVGEAFAKFPLENNSIESHFEDDLSDLPAAYRLQLGPMYKYNLQTKLTTYEPYLETLRKNADKRMKNSKNYQNFLDELNKKNFDSPAVELFSQGDLQYQEALNVAKDLVQLMKD